MEGDCNSERRGRNAKSCERCETNPAPSQAPLERRASNTERLQIDIDNQAEFPSTPPESEFYHACPLCVNRVKRDDVVKEKLPAELEPKSTVDDLLP